MPIANIVRRPSRDRTIVAYFSDFCRRYRTHLLQILSSLVTLLIHFCILISANLNEHILGYSLGFSSIYKPDLMMVL